MGDSWRTTYDHHLKRIHDHPEDGEAWLAFGKFLEEDCIAPDKALRAFQNAHRLLPNDETLLRLGSAYVNAGEAASGIELLQSACTQFPSAHAFAFLADAEMKVKNYRGARSALDSGICLDPEFDELYFLYGESFRRAAEYREAIEWYRKALQIDSSDWRYWQAVGHCELRVDQIDAAIKSLTQAVDINPEAGWAWQYLAVAYMKIGDHDAARTSYERAIEAFPQDDDLRRRFKQYLDKLAYEGEDEAES